ncbi:hypothetical protein ScPMuIL_005862 [Solemya velum]
MFLVFLAVLGFCLFTGTFLLHLLFRSNPSTLKINENTYANNSILIVAGSGGHTTEILKLVSKLGSHYTPRHYILANTDKISGEKINSLESCLVRADSDSEYHIHHVPRSREVRQSWWTTVLSTAYATVFAFPLVFRIKPGIILCNGPGTCIPVCLAGLVLKIFNMGKPKFYMWRVSVV